MNDDGRLDLAEYMKAVFGEGASEVDWKEGEEQFGKDRDLDQDGFMDKEEVRSWMLPETYDEHQVGNVIKRVSQTKVMFVKSSSVPHIYHILVQSNMLVNEHSNPLRLRRDISFMRQTGKVIIALLNWI